MDGLRDDNKWSKSDREKQRATYIWNLKRKKKGRQKTKLWLPKRVGGGVGMDKLEVLD